MSHSSEVDIELQVGNGLHVFEESQAPQRTGENAGQQEPIKRDPRNDCKNNPIFAPWKYVGYRILSRWLASDDAFFMVRRFGALNARVALSMQDEIVQLEEQLDTIDRALSRPDVDKSINNGSFRHDVSKERVKLVKETIPEALTKYSQSYTHIFSRG